MHFVIENRTENEVRGFRAEVKILNDMGQVIATLDTLLLGFEIPGIPPGRKSLRLIIPKMPLMPGRYRITIYSEVNSSMTDYVKDAAAFEVESGDFYGTGRLPAHNDAMFVLEHRCVLGAIASPRLAN